MYRLVRVLPFSGEAGSVRSVEVKARRRGDAVESIVEEEQRGDRRSCRSPEGAGRFLATLVGRHGVRKNCRIALAAALGKPCSMALSGEMPQDRRRNLDVNERQKQQVWGMEDHVQGLVGVSLEQRNRFFLHKCAPPLASLGSAAGLGFDQRESLRKSKCIK